MGCANTKTGGATGEDCIPEGGDTPAQKEVPKVMVDGDETAANGNVVNANGVEEGTTDEAKEPACNGDLTENKRKSKAASDVAEDDSKSGGGATTPSGDAKSNDVNGGEAGMDADAQDGGDEKETAANGSKDETEDQTDQGKNESTENETSPQADDAAESRENNQGGED